MTAGSSPTASLSRKTSNSSDSRFIIAGSATPTRHWLKAQRWRDPDRADARSAASPASNREFSNCDLSSGTVSARTNGLDLDLLTARRREFNGRSSTSTTWSTNGKPNDLPNTRSPGQPMRPNQESGIKPGRPSSVLSRLHLSARRQNLSSFANSSITIS